MTTVHANCPASAADRFGYSGIFLVCSIQVHSWEDGKQTEPEIAWARRLSGLGGGGALLNIIPHIAGLSRDPLYISPLCQSVSIRVRNAAQENVMNTHRGIRLFLVVVNQTYKYNNYQYQSDNHLIGIPRDSITRWNKEQYQHTFSGTMGSGLCSMQVSPPLSGPILVESY